MLTLDWIGKAAAVNHNREASTRLLHCSKTSFGDPEADNLLVEGDAFAQDGKRTCSRELSKSEILAACLATINRLVCSDFRAHEALRRKRETNCRWLAQAPALGRLTLLADLADAFPRGLATAARVGA